MTEWGGWRRAALAALLVWIAGCSGEPGGEGGGTSTPPGSGGVDNDEDGVSQPDDCNDDDPSIFPGAEELCDGVDQDCDQVADEDAYTTFYYDADGDSHGDAAISIQACSAPFGYAAAGDDCDDTNAAIYPGAPDFCDTLDNDCDGSVDEDLFTYYRDVDGDGHGDGTLPAQYCSDEAATAAGYAPVGDDCDDTNAARFPGNEEVCDLIDNDCDYAVDDGLLQTWYFDGDGDGFAAEGATTQQACAQPVGYASALGDCDDTRPTSYPGAPELCNLLDDDCDAAVDEDLSVVWYPDGDGDGYAADDAAGQAVCEPPDGYVQSRGDCNDTQPAVHPGALEVCNDLDDNCDGEIDEEGARGEVLFYRDADGDGYGTVAQSVGSCDPTPPAGYVANDDDCNDTSASVNPAAAELCNQVDDNCDGAPGRAETIDSDGDGTINCADSSVYSIDFSAGAPEWQDRNLYGDGDWSSSGGVLCEDDGTAVSYAFGPDLGDLNRFTMQMDMASMGEANDGMGFVVGRTSLGFYALIWLDPNDYYGDYNPPGEIELWRCDYVGGGGHDCDRLAADDDSRSLTLPYDTFVPATVRVIDSTMSLEYGGATIFSYTLPGGALFEAGAVGFYSDNSDSGVCYDNLVVSLVP